MRKYVFVVSVLLLVLITLVGCEGASGVDSVILATNSCEIVADETHVLSYQVIPGDADMSGFSWKSANESVATVDASGTISAHEEGQTTVFLTDGERTFATCAVTVLRKAAYDLLNDTERDFVDMALRYINGFKNPDSVEILDIAFIEGEGTSKPFWVVEVSAENGFGGTDKEVYVLDNTYGFHSNEYILMVPFDKEYYRLDLINEAIDEKC